VHRQKDLGIFFPSKISPLRFSLHRVQDTPLSNIVGAEVEERAVTADYVTNPFFRMVFLYRDGTRQPLRPMFDPDRTAKDRIVRTITSFVTQHV
jgi:hypothetical protein